MKVLSLTLGLAALLSGCGGSKQFVKTSERQTHERLHSTLYLQSAAEYDAVCLSIYRAALADLDRALADNTWTAALEQGQDFSQKPPAIILDVDETVLDNSVYQARLIRDKQLYGASSWDPWCKEEKGVPVPGALEYLKAADQKGATIFYITNRDSSLDIATWNNLRKIGFPQTQTEAQVLSTNEEPEWTSDKTSRRNYVCRTHRVVQIVGDNLNDFVASKLAPAARDSLVSALHDWWGSRWYMLPNPDYGYWEGALIDYDYKQADSTQLRRKFQALRYSPR